MKGSSKVHSLMLLRCSVLLHGEKAQPAWWLSTAASRGATDIRYAFPRTATTAAFRRAAELAKTLHDERTRKQDYYHLFRLPYAIEADIHHETLRLDQAGELTPDKVESFFESFLEDAFTNNKTAEGAVDCDKISIFKNSDLKRIGALYREAFDSGKICLPYFILDS